MSRVTIIGGGVWAPQLVERLVRRLYAAGAEPVDLCLMARRPGPLAAICAEAQRRLERAGLPGRVEATTDRATALRGADGVILMARIGGYAARARDERFPRSVGLVGDEGLGPGGVANAWRSLPWVQRFCEAALRHCPSAWIMNLMAPLGVITQAILSRGLQAVGVCELPAVTRAALTDAPGGRYGGLNHLGWFWDLPGRPGLHPLKYVARVFGEPGRPRPVLPPAGRAEALAGLSDALIDAFERPAHTQSSQVDALEAQRPVPWFDEAVIPATLALLGAGEWVGYANVANADLIPELPRSHVVEVAARWTTDGAIQAVAPGPLPASITPFLQAVARAEQITLVAAEARDPGPLVEAMLALPLGLDRVTAAELARAAIQPAQPVQREDTQRARPSEEARS